MSAQSYNQPDRRPRRQLARFAVSHSVVDSSLLRRAPAGRSDKVVGMVIEVTPKEFYTFEDLPAQKSSFCMGPEKDRHLPMDGVHAARERVQSRALADAAIDVVVVAHGHADVGSERTRVAEAGRTDRSSRK